MIVNTIDIQQPNSASSVYIVQSRFNLVVTERLFQGAYSALQQAAYENRRNPIHIGHVKVPGAVEIPFVAQQLARSKCCQAIVALGAVIRGETSHYDLVCQQVSSACQQVALQFDIPVIFGILTVDTVMQALERSGGVRGNKGYDAAKAALQMIAVQETINQLGNS